MYKIISNLADLEIAAKAGQLESLDYDGETWVSVDFPLDDWNETMGDVMRDISQGTFRWKTPAQGSSSDLTLEQ